MAQKSLIDAFNDAAEGFVYVVKTQRNMRIHFLLGIFVFLLGIYLQFTRVELLILSSTIALVLMAEMINTAIEHAADLIETGYHPVIRIVKDVSAGAVLVASLNAVIVGYLLFARPMLLVDIDRRIRQIQQAPSHLTFASLVLVLALVIGIKVLLHRGTPMRGGMPSGHAALAFSVWTITALLTQNEILIVLVFVLAFWVAQSRIQKGIHDRWEVIAGAVLGVIATILTFQIFGPH